MGPGVILANIRDSHIASDVASDVRASLLEALRLLETLEVKALRHMEFSFLESALRAIEIVILGDPVILNMAAYWDALDDRRARVEVRLITLLGFKPPEELLIYVCQRIADAYAIAHADGDEVTVIHEEQLFAGVMSVSVELRCAVCGYHFRQADLGAGRLRICRDAGLELADYYHPERSTDAYKPHSLPGHSLGRSGTSLTQFTIDHIVPRSGFGAASAANLQPLCSFCNNAKKLYRRARESSAASVAGALMAWKDPSRHSIPKQLTVFASIYEQRKCSVCDRMGSEGELTVRSFHLDGRPVQQEFAPLLPWRLQVICYDCVVQARRE